MNGKTKLVQQNIMSNEHLRFCDVRIKNENKNVAAKLKRIFSEKNIEILRT